MSPPLSHSLGLRAVPGAAQTPQESQSSPQSHLGGEQSCRRGFASQLGHVSQDLKQPPAGSATAPCPESCHCRCPQGWLPVTQSSQMCPSCEVLFFGSRTQLRWGSCTPRSTGAGQQDGCGLPGAAGNHYPRANSMEISMCLGKRQPSPSAARGRGLQRFPGSGTESPVCHMGAV